MSKNTNRKGLALGAMFSLVASLFVGAAPASANVTNAFTIAPAGANTSAFGTFVDDDFTLLITRNVSVVTAADFSGADLKVSITTDRTWGSTFSVVVVADTSSGTAALSVATNSVMPGQSIFVSRDGLSAAALSMSNALISTTISGTAPAAFATEPSPWASTTAFVVDHAQGSGATQLKVGLRLSGVLGTFSPSVVVNVRPFLDLNGNNIWDSASEPSATQAVNFYRYSAVAPTVTFSAPEPGTSYVTASAVMSSLLNMDQIPGKFAIRFTQFQGHQAAAAVSYSATAERTLTNATGNSLSDTITLGQAASSSNTLSAQVVYSSVSPYAILGSGGTTEEPTTKWGLSTVTPAATQVTAQTLYAVKGANALANGNIRANSLVTVRYSASAVASASVPVTFTFDDNVTLSSTKTITVDGGTAKTSGTASAVTKNVAEGTGVASITINTTDFVAGDTITVTADAVGLPATSVTLTVVALSYTLTADSSQVAIAPGGSVAVGVDVEDQFGEASSATNQRVRFRWATGYNGTATQSDVAVAAGRASATMVHAPATSTVSATIWAELQNTVGGSNIWTSVVSDAKIMDVTVTNAANGFRTGLAKSYSATISYGANFSWSPLINEAYVIVTGSSVVVSGTGLIFKDAVLGLTASDRITLPGDSNALVKFYVTARKAGTYTLTLTAGTATTTSLIVVSAAQDNAGSAMAFDISSMESGRAAIVTGTLTDLNGNPVDTTLGGASVALSVTGTGATYVGSLNTETNADGKFQVALLSGTNQTGTITITAVYSPTTGAVAADKVTKVHTVSVVAPTAPEVNAVIGSFNGRWAVRVENAKGSVVSVKAGNRWVKFSALNNNYLYSMKSVKGRTIAVSVWVDGELQNSQTITIK